MKVSCIIISAESKSKGRCLRHCLLSVLNQSAKGIEIVIIHNDKIDISDQINEVSQIFPGSIDIKILDVGEENLSPGAARNRAVQASSGDLLLFLDDDVVMTDHEVFTKTIEKSKTYDYGYGATRHRTKPLGRFEEHADEIFIKLRDGLNPFENHIGAAPLGIRGSNEVELQNHSFISHFGFCKKKLFERVGGFPDFKEYGMEDQALMFLLYKESNNYCLLKDIELYHITHDFGKSDKNCLPQYYDFLIKNNAIWFNVRATFMKLDDGTPIEDPITPLGIIHYDYRIVNSYSKYKTLHPPELNKSSPFINERRDNNSFSLLDFAIQVNNLLTSKDLNEFIQDSEADFDNIIPFLYSCIHQGIVKVNGGVIESSFDFKHFPAHRAETSQEYTFIPKQHFNQFPCDDISRSRRVDLIKERYPFADYMKIALIGDDDMLANSIGLERWIDVTIVEKDRDVIDAIEKRDNIHIIEHDIQNDLLGQNKVNTFIADPPYTINGILAFLKTGLNLIQFDGEVKEFYLICNPTILGHKSMLYVQQILLESGIYIHQIRKNFSYYKLPSNFPEYDRMIHFTDLEKINSFDIAYSSSSNLYILRSTGANLIHLEKHLNYNLMYEHYLDK